MNFNLRQEDINYIKIIYKDSAGFLHITKAAVKRIDTKEVFASAKFEEKWFIKTPQDVDVSFILDSGLYKAHTELKYVDKDDSYIYFALRKPTNIEFKQNREYFRVKLKIKTTINYFDNGEYKRLECLSHDISANGICVILPEIINFSEEVNLEIDIENKEIKTEAKYIRADYEDGNIRASFNFENLREQDLDYISQICIQKQIEERRNTF